MDPYKAIAFIVILCGIDVFLVWIRSKIYLNQLREQVEYFLDKYFLNQDAERFEEEYEDPEANRERRRQEWEQWKKEHPH